MHARISFLIVISNGLRDNEEFVVLFGAFVKKYEKQKGNDSVINAHVQALHYL